MHFSIFFLEIIRIQIKLNCYLMLLWGFLILVSRKIWRPNSKIFPENYLNLPNGHIKQRWLWNNADYKTTLIIKPKSISRYSEIKDYDYGTADTKNGKAVGHFTQLVWKDTTQVGVGIASKKSGRLVRLRWHLKWIYYGSADSVRAT